MPVRAQPYAHQKAAFNFAWDKFTLPKDSAQSRGVALLMEMGCGKTLVGVALAGALNKAGKVKRVLIVAPLSILGVWEKEFQDYAAYPYSLTVLSGSCEQKAKQLKSIRSDGLEVAVINYESAWRIAKDLLRWNPELVIADEGHKLKESRTAQAKALHLLGDKAGYKLLLTGTVITNRELDVFSQYRFLDRRVFGDSYYSFRSRYFEMVGYGRHIPRFRESERAEFLRRLHSIAYRVTKEECLDLPETTEELRYVALEGETKKLYDKLEKESYAELDGSEVSTVNVLTKLLRLSQLTGGHITDDAGGCKSVGSAKLDALSDILDSSAAEGKKLVVMARFVPELQDIEALLRKKGLGYASVRGGVKDRAEQIRRFQNDEDCLIFVGQIAAAGLGITLTAASTMVFYSMDYSMSNFEQAKARIHRVSQRNDCHYIYLAAKNTVDTKVLRALREKADLAKLLVDDYRKGLDPFEERNELHG